MRWAKVVQGERLHIEGGMIVGGGSSTLVTTVSIFGKLEITPILCYFDFLITLNSLSIDSFHVSEKIVKRKTALFKVNVILKIHT